MEETFIPPGAKPAMGYDMSKFYGIDARGIPFFYHISTSNLSFIQTAMDLKSLGIKNNAFFLALYNPDLADVDPFSPNLTKEQVQAIINECIINPWYFIRECVRIPEQGGGTGPGAGSKFRLHRGNLAACWCFFRNIDLYLVIPRQCFKTHSMLACLNWAYIFGTSNSVFNFSNKSQKDSDDNLRKMKEQKDVLPIYMQHRYGIELDESGDFKQVKGLDNVRTMTNPVNGNRIDSKPSAATEEKADGIGRGNSAPIQFYDEVEFTKYIGTIIMAAGPAYVRAAENAKKNGAMFGRIFITTPGNIDSQPVKDSMSTREQAAVFTERLYDMTEEDIQGFLKANSRNGIVYIEFNYKQIGMDEEWYQKVCAVSNWDKIKIKREVLLQRIRGTSQSPFDPDDLDTINGFRKEPIDEIMVNKIFTLYVYERLDKSVPYILGVDCATGVNNDNTVLMVIDPYTLHPVACMKTPLADAVETAQNIIQVVNRYIPKALVAIESNHLGSAIIAILKRSSIAANLYYDIDKAMVPDVESRLDKHGMVMNDPNNRRFYGVATTATTRPMMMQILLRHVAERKSDFICRELIDDLNNLIQKASGKIEAAPGEHDDVVMAYLIALFVYYHGSKLTRYGITKYDPRKPIGEKVKKVETYDDAYNALPDELKQYFPNPQGQSIYQSYGGLQIDDVPQQKVDPNPPPAYYQSAREQYINTSSGLRVGVINDEYQEKLHAPYEDAGYDDYSGAFDVCDILNSD
jgi:PHIKZ025